MTNANNFFGSSNGSEDFYRHPPTGIVYTDGIKSLAEKCQAYWLIDLIVSHQCNKTVSLEPFQVWELKRQEGNVFNIVATDGNNCKIATQHIPFSDFPYDLATLWLVDGCLLLPKEY